MSTRPLVIGCAAIALAACLASQRPVVTVGGVSPDYPDLPQAVAAVAPGTVIEVRPGVYTGFDTDKELRIVLDGSFLTTPAGANYTVRVHDVVGVDGFAMRGGGIASGPVGAVRIERTASPIVLENTTLIGAGFQVGLDVFDCGTVHVSRSFLIGDPGLQARFCNLVSNENIVGNNFGVGAVVSNSRLESSRAIYAGSGQAAVRLLDSEARLGSDGTSALLVLGAPTVPVSVIDAFGSRVEWDPSRFILQMANGAPPVNMVTSTEVTADVPMLNAGPAAVGTIATVRLAMPTPTPAVIATSRLLPVPIVLGFESLFIDPNVYEITTVGLAGPTGLVASFPVPNDPAIHGEVLAFQGLVFLPSGAAKFSGPALWYFH